MTLLTSAIYVEGLSQAIATIRANPSSPVCTTAVVATAAAMASPANDARSGLPRMVAIASESPST